MAQRPEDILVSMLNIDAEIRGRLVRLAELERSAEDSMAPWLNEARTVLRGDMAVLRTRREEHFLRLNALRAGGPHGQPRLD